MTALSIGNLGTALSELGQTEEARTELIRTLLAIEPRLAARDKNVREEVTGPIVDAMFRPGELVERTIASGLRFSFPYRSKIARDFVMANESTPDHVWEPQTTKLLLGLSATAERVIVGGAYFGDQAIPMAHAMPKTGRIHCFDVNVEQIRVLQTNATQNGLADKITTVERALWDHSNRRLKLVGDDSHAYVVEVQEESPDTFVTTTIDDYSKSVGMNRVDLIMLDIEGAELAALKGAETLLAQAPDVAPRLVFEVHRSYLNWDAGLLRTDLMSYLVGHGYHCFAVRDYQSNVPMAGRPVEIVPLDDIYLEGPPHGFNIFATKQLADVQRLGLVMCPGVSPKLLPHRDPRFHAPLH